MCLFSSGVAIYVYHGIIVSVLFEMNRRQTFKYLPLARAHTRPTSTCALHSYRRKRGVRTHIPTTRATTAMVITIPVQIFLSNWCTYKNNPLQINKPLQTLLRVYCYYNWKYDRCLGISLIIISVAVFVFVDIFCSYLSTLKFLLRFLISCSYLKHFKILSIQIIVTLFFHNHNIMLKLNLLRNWIIT